MGTLMMALPLAEGGFGSLRRLSEGLPMGWGALLGVVLLAGGSGGLQRWAHQPPYTEANPGEEVLMPCIVQNIQVGGPATYFILSASFLALNVINISIILPSSAVFINC